MGFQLPEPFSAPAGVVFKFEPVRVSGGLAYVSGHGPMDGTEVLISGKVDETVTLEQAVEATRQTALSQFASLKAELGDLDRVTGWVKMIGFVNTGPGFNRMPAVINGASELILGLWGDDGRHARTAIGVRELPFDWPVEIEAIVEIEN